MPESRNRAGHKYQKPADIPSSQRTSGHLLWALLFAVFGALMLFFAVGGWVAVAIGAAIGGIVGWWLGRKMEKEARNK